MSVPSINKVESKNIKSDSLILSFAKLFGFENALKFLSWGNMMSNNPSENWSLDSLVKIFDLKNFFSSFNNRSLDNWEIPTIFFLMIFDFCFTVWPQWKSFFVVH